MNVKRQEEEATAEEIGNDDTTAEEVQSEDGTGDDGAEEIAWEEAPSDGTTSGWDYDGDYEEYLGEVSGDYEGGEDLKKRLLSYAAGDNADHAVAKVRFARSS